MTSEALISKIQCTLSANQKRDGELSVCKYYFQYRVLIQSTDE